MGDMNMIENPMAKEEHDGSYCEREAPPEEETEDGLLLSQGNKYDTTNNIGLVNNNNDDDELVERIVHRDEKMIIVVVKNDANKKENCEHDIDGSSLLQTDQAPEEKEEEIKVEEKAEIEDLLTTNAEHEASESLKNKDKEQDDQSQQNHQQIKASLGQIENEANKFYDYLLTMLTNQEKKRDDDVDVQECQDDYDEDSNDQETLALPNIKQEIVVAVDDEKMNKLCDTKKEITLSLNHYIDIFTTLTKEEK